jgi:outer membrane protein assembly factor BamC
MNISKSYPKKSLVLLLVTLLAGCGGSVFEKKIDYKSAGQLPPLEIPPDLSKPRSDDRYSLPEQNPDGTATLSEYNHDRQPQLGSSAILPAAANVRIERAGTQRWLVVQATPEQLWDTIKEFWQETGFLIGNEMPQAGIMETDWAENRAKIPEGGIRKLLGKILDQAYSTPERDRFRTRMERGEEAGTTEIYISHRGMYEVLKGNPANESTIWQPRPADPELEAEMLYRLMARLGAKKQQIEAQAKKAQEIRANLAPGGSSLILNDAFDRAWRRVGLALDRVGFTVEDRDRSKGLYFVRYIDPDAETGKKKSWFSWGSDKKKPEQYRISVNEAGTSTEVQVLSAAGTKEMSPASGRILALLQEQLK